MPCIMSRYTWAFVYCGSWELLVLKIQSISLRYDLVNVILNPSCQSCTTAEQDDQISLNPSLTHN